MRFRRELIVYPNKFRLKHAIIDWDDVPATTTTSTTTTSTTAAPSSQYVYYTDGLAEWRKGVRDGCFVWDHALTLTGFDGVEDFDWENVRMLCAGASSSSTDAFSSQYVEYFDGITLWRKGVRDGCFVWDHAMTLLGFDGTEDIDWENVKMLCWGGVATTEAPTEDIVLGLLYNDYASSDARNITSEGWHVPTRDDLDVITTYLGGTFVAGGKIKETGTEYWNSPNTGATNVAKFNGRGAGLRSATTGVFSSIDTIMMIWSATAWSLSMKYIQSLSYDSNNFYNGSIANIKTGMSIRPVKDSTTLSHGEEGTYTDPSGYVYRTICIGTQEWVADNIKTQHYRNGDPIPEVTDNAAWAALSTGAMCAYNNDWNNV